MTPRARSAATMAVLCLLLVLGLVVGWTTLTRPLPGSAPEEKCTVVTVAAGEKVAPDQVLVSVLNTSKREGLAGRTMQLFVDEGFGEGDRGNAPRNADVRRAQVWSSDPDNPAVRLVRSWLGRGTRVVDRPSTVPGVVVVVGDEFEQLARGRKQVRTDEDSRICSPTAPAAVD